MRPIPVGETMLLRWSDVDLDRDLLTIRPEISKSKRGRVIPITEHLAVELACWGVRDGWLIPSTRKVGVRERVARPRDADRAWARAGVRAEVWDGEPFHAFRRGFKSGLLALRAHPDAVDYLQGHKLGTGARDRYIDPMLALPLVETVGLVPMIGVSVDEVIRFRGRGGERG
jgi:integrase